MNTTHLFRTIMTVAGVSVAAFSAPQAQANITISLAGTPVQMGSNYVYTYNIALDGAERLDNKTASSTGVADFFTIYDFAGLVGTPTISAPTQFAYSSTAFGPTPDGTNTPGVPVPVTDSSTPNLTFTYTGGNPSVAATTGAGPQSWTVTAVSTLNAINVSGNYAQQATQAGGFLVGKKDAGVGPLPVPAMSSVPEPTTIASFGLGGFGLLGLMVRARKARKTVA